MHNSVTDAERIEPFHQLATCRPFCEIESPEPVSATRDPNVFAVAFLEAATSRSRITSSDTLILELTDLAA